MYLLHREIQILLLIDRTCSMLMAPDNGMIDCSLGGDGVPTNGDTCTVTCNDGFRLRGDATRRCRAGQMRWLGDEARCEPGVEEMYNFFALSI